MKLTFYSLSSLDRTHWPDAYNTLFTLEATGYALLALMKLKQMQEAATVFEWLSKQRRRGGGYGSTQVPAGGILAIFFCKYDVLALHQLLVVSRRHQS